MKIITFFYFFIMIMALFFVSCKNPAPNCKEFCKFRTNIKDGENLSNENGFGEFNKNGSPALCNYYYNGWPSFEVILEINSNKYKICTNPGFSLNSKGLTPWFIGNRCISQAEAKNYINANIKLSLENLTNNFFVVRGRPGMCPNQCVIYKIFGLEGDIRYTIDKDNCGINIDIKARALKNYNGNYICINCDC